MERLAFKQINNEGDQLTITTADEKPESTIDEITTIPIPPEKPAETTIDVVAPTIKTAKVDCKAENLLLTFTEPIEAIGLTLGSFELKVKDDRFGTNAALEVIIKKCLKCLKCLKPKVARLPKQSKVISRLF